MKSPIQNHGLVGQLMRARHQLPVTIDTLRKVLPLARSHYGFPYPDLAMRAMMLLHRRFMPDEAFQLGLFDPSIDKESLRRYLSKSSLKQLQNRLNPLPWDRLVEDKGVFYRLCRALDLPSPELYAIVYRNRPGWVAGERLPRNQGEWEKFIESELPGEFIVKPTFGVYGRGVAAYVRTDEAFESSTGEILDARALLQTILGDRRDRGFVIQERLRSHPAIARLSGTDALQTARIDVIATPKGPHILNAGIKFIRGNNIIDNLHSGATGNFIMRIAVDDGRVLDGRGMERGRPGFRTISHHPVTGHELTGMQIPHWDEIRNLLFKAMDTFQPLKAVGWDVGITAEGARLIEGNAWFDPALNLQGRAYMMRAAADPAEYMSRVYSFLSKGPGIPENLSANA